MITKIFYWIKSNKLSAFLIFILLFLGAKTFLFSSRSLVGQKMMYTGSSAVFEDAAMPSYGGGVTNYAKRIAPEQPAPINPTSDRMVITNSYFSLLVKSVTDTVAELSSKVKSMGGYLVNTNISRPEQGEDASITLRVPTDKVEDLQKFLRASAVKVVSEEISGQDITDQYTDIQSRIDTLQNMARRVQAILDEAITVQEMLNAQNQLFSIQNQIDSYIGQLKYMEGASSTSLISVNLSTDELALPYAPVRSWRPQLIFKEAVRSLLGTLQSGGSFAIWLGVYSIILIPAGLLVYLIWKYIKR